ncbi:MAG: hypothetical protein NE327_11690, partial [Lentisphaeraceae bacterium]|nr:hypothetical protein [Lentisphaeraceae bacterium]
MKNKILLSSLLLIAVVLVAVVSYKITISTPVEDFTHKPVTRDKKAKKPEKNHTEKSSENDTAGKKKIVASKEVNSVNLQILSSADLEQIAKNSDSMNDFIAVLQNKEKLPVSLSLNLLLTAISNFENEMKLEILFYEKSPYNKLLKTLSDSPSTDLEIKKEVERILISKSEPDYKAVEMFTQFVIRNSDHIEALLKDERFIPLKDSLELQNKFLHSSSSISNLKSFESIYTESVCNSEGDSFIEKIDSVKRISGSGLAEQQQKIYEYLLKTLPSRVPLSKKYERQIYA